MEDEVVEKAVLAYLKSKGYRAAELAFQDDQQQQQQQANRIPSSAQTPPEPSLSPSLLNHILLYSKSDNDPGRYKEGYGKLRSWVHSSLDLYKNELLRILYPVFLHSYMDLVAKGFSQEARVFFQSFRDDHKSMHLRDLQKLEGVISPQHLKENEFACTFRKDKVNIKMCQYSFELLLQYLHSTESTLMLSIVNEHINLKVFPGQASPFPIEDDAITLIGQTEEHVESINQKEIRWGVLEDSLDDKLEKVLATEAERVEADGKEGEAEDGKKKTLEVGKIGVLNKKGKKEKSTGTIGKASKLDSSATHNFPRVQPELSMPIVSEEAERQALEDLRNRARLGSNALPSVSFYSFINTHNSLNCASISADGSLLVGGFSDSSLKVWDMAKLGMQHMSSEGESFDKDQTQGSIASAFEIKGTQYTHFIGHAGPVYAANFSPDGAFILSASADCTVRLWSNQLNANLVCYKGHNYPVWDVQYSPVGHYFASASHDRTARVWSMDRIQPLRIMAGHLSDVDCVQWHVNCNYIGTGSSDKTVRLWDIQTGECMRIFAGHRGMVLSLAMSPDGRYMASGDEDGAIMMWDLGSGRCVTPILGHSSCIWSLAFSGEGSILASGSADNTLKLWDVNGSAKPGRNGDKGEAIRHLRLLKNLSTKCTPVHTLKFSRRNLLFAAGAFTPLKLPSTEAS